MTASESNLARRRAVRRARIKYRGMQAAFTLAVVVVVVFVLAHLGWT